MSDLYEALGVSRRATPAEIKAAHRQKVAIVHPDKPGGSQDEFERVQKAYETLSDPKKRAHYDRTGTADDLHEAQRNAQALEAMNQIVGKILGQDSIDLDATDLVAVIQAGLDQTVATIRKDLVLVASRLDRLDKMERRFKAKRGRGAKADFARQALKMVMSGQRQMYEAEKTRIERALDLHLRVKDVFERFGYEFEPVVEPRIMRQTFDASRAAWPS